ncbi:TolC family protein [Lutibacter flavus]|uniref:Outer membrane protein TolC n=1 Tax=Lutibacter flavus TaxID=691689 RepID=A0A238YK19_9FLAO|nr:TolC family protein [Lutibacter flavus]SNR70759.1 Outer membrane protein TolC [Lutibacter flavus]
MKIKIGYIIVFFITISSYGQSMKEYLNIAEKNNPELKAMQYKYESALEKVNEEGSLPNTTIGAGFLIQEAETRVGAQKAKLSVSQMMPWFGTLQAKKESASFKADAQSNSIDLSKRKLFLNVKTDYFQLYELNEKERIIKKNINILKTFEDLALNELENNRSTMVDVLKIRMEKNELSNKLSEIVENLKTAQITFNLILNREENLLVNIPKNIEIIDDSNLFKKEMISDNPQLLKLDNLQNAIEKAELVSKKEGLPTIGIGLDYAIVENRAVENLLDNGKDIIMPMITVSVPLFSKKYSSKQKQLQLDQKAIETIKINAKNQLYTIFEKAKSKMVNAKTSIKTQIENIKEVDNTKKLLFVAYETSIIDFDQLLEIQQLKLKFQLKKVVSEKEYAIQKSTLEFLTKNE